MFKNYLKSAFRSLAKNRFSSFINIVGLSVGMAVTLLIGLWIWNELTFDNYFKNHKNLAEIVSVTTYNGSTTAHKSASVPLANELRKKVPDDLRSVALTSEGGHVLSTADKNKEEWGMWAQSNLPEMLTLKMLRGDARGLKDPSSLMISGSLAKILFNKADPLNKLIHIDNKTAMKVVGVYEDLPMNTSFYGTNFFLSWENKDNPGNEEPDDWTNHHYKIFVQLNDQLAVNKVSDKIKDISKPYLRGGWEEIMLYPMDQWHLYDEFHNGKMSTGSIQYVWLFGIIGSFVLLLACINFMNLSTASSERRAKEVGIRKAIGSLRSQLILQFFCESLLTAFIGLVFAVLIVQLSLPFFNVIANKELSIPYGQPLFWVFIFGFTTFSGLVAGSYPALYLSGFKAIRVLKGTFKAGKFASFPRKVLVTVQFTVSISLIIGTIVVFNQIQFAKNRTVGYDREGLITIDMKTEEIRNHFDALRNELINTGVVMNAAESSSPSTDVQNNMLGYDWKGKDPNSLVMIGTVFTGYSLGQTLGWEIKEGRDFSLAFSNDSGGIILNEEAVKLTGFKNPVGESIKWHGQNHIILGVVKDMVMESPYMPVEPTFFMLDNRKIHVITIRLKPTSNMQESIAKIESVFKKYDPESPFEFSFNDEDYARKFSNEENIGKLTRLFTVLAIFISCIGLFGLASFVAEQRTKEIGIRRVLGASVFSVWKLLSVEFVMLILISFLIAMPLAAYFMHRWLLNYQYRTQLSLWIFIVTISGAIIITILTVSFQAINAALANPVKSLKTE